MKIDALKLTEEVRAKLLKEVDRLAKQPYSSAEASVIRNYLDVCGAWAGAAAPPGRTACPDSAGRCSGQ